jgi:hypothetical protein
VLPAVAFRTVNEALVNVPVGAVSVIVWGEIRLPVELVVNATS